MPTHSTGGCAYTTQGSIIHSEPCLDPPDNDDRCPDCAGETSSPNGIDAECMDAECGWVSSNESGPWWTR